MLVLEPGVRSPGDTALLCGDSPVIIRYCSGTGQSRNTGVHAALSEPLGWMAASSHASHWVLIPRSRNVEADRCARTAARHARFLAAQGVHTASVWSTLR